MWLVIAAMRRPVTVAVAVLAMVLAAALADPSHARGHLP